MKKQTNKNDNVTKGYLEEQLDKRFRDFGKKMDEKFDRIDKRFDRLITYMEMRFASLEEMRQDFYAFRDQTQKNFDWLIGAYKRFDEEHTSLSAKCDRLEEKLKNHIEHHKTP